MLIVETVPFEAAHAELLVGIAGAAFASLPAEARPKDTPAFVGHLHGPANPAGAARLALARLDGRCVGSVSAIPARFRRRDGGTATGWQIGSFFVDASVQRQGVGGKLLEAITAALRPLPGSFVYTFPNQRSIHVFDKQGYRRLATIPTFVHPPTPASILRGPRRLRDGAGGEWELDFPAGPEVAALLRPAGAPPPREPGFLRDEAYFAWRFCGPDAGLRYTIARCRERGGGGTLLVALAGHRFASLRFEILVDAWPDALRERLGLAVRAAQAAGARRGARLVYVNTNCPRTSGTPWRVKVPQARNPRPVELLMHPDTSAIDPRELAGSLVMTADWMGF